MGEYADLAIDRDIDGWSGRSFRRGAVLRGFGEPATLFKKVVACNRCGYPTLYWQQAGGKWRLHHWSCPTPDAKPQFVLHRCGLQSDGKPSAKWPMPPHSEPHQ